MNNDLRLELEGIRARSSFTTQIRSEFPDKDRPEADIMQGKIVSVQATTCTVNLQGSTVAVAGVAWLTAIPPVANDTVWIIKLGTDRFIIGKQFASNAWYPYTPTWSSTGVDQPSIGNGTLLGRYSVAAGICHVRWSMNLGSTSSPSSAGEYRWALPLAAYLPASSNYLTVGYGMNYDTSTAWKYGRGIEFPNDNMKCRMVSLSGGDVSSSYVTPFTWAVGDEAHCSFFYELA